MNENKFILKFLNIINIIINKIIFNLIKINYDNISYY